MAYREGPPAASLPFPRRGLALLTACVVVLSAMVFVLPLPFMATRRGLQLFREGGLGMGVLAVTSMLVAAGCGVAGALAVRGRRAPAVVVIGVPFAPALLGALFGALGATRLFAASVAVEPDVRARLFTAGLGEIDALPAYGCFLSAIACGAAAVALLGGAASVDRRSFNAPSGGAWIASLVLGGIAFVVVLVLPVVLSTGTAALLLAVPSVVILTTFAALAGLAAPLVRHWREPREADHWIASVLAAALLSAAGLALLWTAASFFAESAALGAVAGEGIDPAQRAAILASAADEHHAYRVLAIVSGVLGFVIALPGAIAGLGRGTDGRLRFPRGAPLVAAIAGVGALAASTAVIRAWELGRIEALAGTGASSPSGQAAETLDLPRVPSTARLSFSASAGTVVRVDAAGRSKLQPAPLDLRSSVLVVEADRRATWGDVSRAIREAVRASRADLSANLYTSIELRVTLLDKADRSGLGPYGALVGPETAALHLAIDGAGADRAGDDEEDADLRGRGGLRGPTVVRPRAHEIMDAIAAAIAMRPIPFGSRAGVADLTILPPDGAW